MKTPLRLITNVLQNALARRARTAGAAIAIAATFTFGATATADQVSDAGETSDSNHGPSIMIEAPRLDGAPVTGPVTIALAWSAQDGAEVDLDSLRVWYKLGFVSKNVTKTVLSAMRNSEGSRLDATGLFVPDANLPTGRHRLVIELADTRNRRSYAQLDLHVAKR